MGDHADAEPILRELHELGLQLALDDFGSGYSSLSRLREMPMETLKIDRAFLREVPESREAAAIVTAILRLARALGRTAVAEGVETEEQRALPRRAGLPAAPGLPARPPDAGRRGRGACIGPAALRSSAACAGGVTVRDGPAGEQARAEELADALDLVEREGRALAAGRGAGARAAARAHVRAARSRSPARVELAGRAACAAGVDVRGDGAAEAWTGRIRRAAGRAAQARDALRGAAPRARSEHERGAVAPQPARRARASPGTRDSSSAQKRGEWSITSRWQTSCSTT